MLYSYFISTLPPEVKRDTRLRRLTKPTQPRKSTKPPQLRKLIKPTQPEGVVGFIVHTLACLTYYPTCNYSCFCHPHPCVGALAPYTCPSQILRTADVFLTQPPTCLLSHHLWREPWSTNGLLLFFLFYLWLATFSVPQQLLSGGVGGTSPDLNYFLYQSKGVGKKTQLSWLYQEGVFSDPS